MKSMQIASQTRGTKAMKSAVIDVAKEIGGKQLFKQ